MALLQSVWNDYKKLRGDSEHFTDNVSVVFVPTAAGARGYDAARHFLSQVYDTRNVVVKENVLHRTVGDDSVIEEAEVKIDFVSGECSWLIPGVSSSMAVGATIVIPMVTAATFEADRIASLRVYWDQASVLKQLKLITDKNSWPILAEREIDGVRDVNSAHLNPFSKSDVAAGVAHMNIGDTPRRQVHTSARILMPGGTGGRSTVFDDTPVEATRTKHNPNKNASQFLITDDDPPTHETPRRQVHTSARILQPGGTGGKSSVFGDEPLGEPIRTKHNPNKNVSQFTLQGEDDDAASTFSTGSKKRPGKTQFESSISLGDDDDSKGQQPQDPNPGRAPNRPSTRVARPPGGGSQIRFG